MAVDANEYGPFDAGAGATVGEQQWGRIFASVLSDGKSPGILNSLEVTERGAGANMSVDVASGQAMVQGHQGRWESTSNLSIAANSSGSTRYDSVVVRSNRSTNKVELDVVSGAATSATGDPTLTQTSTIWEVEIARVTVANGATSITDSVINNLPAFAGPPIAAPSAGVLVNVAVPIPDLTVTALAGNSVVWDSGKFWSASQPTRLTLRKRGIYIYGGQVLLKEDGAGAHRDKGIRNVTITQNGGTAGQSPQSTVYGQMPSAPTVGILAGVVPDSRYINVSGMGFHGAGEYLELTAFQTSGAAMSVTVAFFWATYLGAYDA